MKQTTQVRANLKIDDALILDLIREKEKKPLGQIITELLTDSPRWHESKKKLQSFRDKF